MYIIVFADAATPLVQELLLPGFSQTRELVVILNAVILLWF